MDTFTHNQSHQVVLPLLNSDLYDIMQACVVGTLNSTPVEWHAGAAATVVAAAPGYPQSYPKGLTITGADTNASDVMVFHAGTKQDGQVLVTSGGRVLAVTARANTIRDAINKSYKRMADVHFEGMHFRKDIGWRALLQEDEATAAASSLSSAAKRAPLDGPVLIALAVGLTLGFAIGRRF
jgi:phosphoribosylamine--glycine ligase